MQIRHLNSYALIIFLGVALAASVMAYFKTSWKNEGLFNGKSTATYEKAFDKKLMHRQPSIEGWNKVGYRLFGEGKEGVLIGQENWLFTNEEFAHGDGFEAKIAESKSYILSVTKKLADNNVKLVVVPVPSKARVYQDKLGRYKFPAYWKLQYSHLLSFLDSHDIENINLLSLFNKHQNNEIYFKTDTHWTPMGARLAAMAVEQKVSKKFPYLSWKQTNFKSVKGEVTEHEGDLMRYTANIPKDKFATWSTQPFGEGDGDLFGDVELPITLVGTSYSANQLWNFEGFLKEMLGSDVLNVADEGLGPFATMKNYIASDAYKNNKPKLIIWEMPERYLAITPNT